MRYDRFGQITRNFIHRADEPLDLFDEPAAFGEEAVYEGASLPGELTEPVEILRKECLSDSLVGMPTKDLFEQIESGWFPAYGPNLGASAA